MRASSHILAGVKATIQSNGNKVSFKFNRKTAEVRTWVGGEFIGAEVISVEAAKAKLAGLTGKGWK